MSITLGGLLVTAFVLTLVMAAIIEIIKAWRCEGDER
jgi:hypothetical protein